MGTGIREFGTRAAEGQQAQPADDAALKLPSKPPMARVGFDPGRFRRLLGEIHRDIAWLCALRPESVAVLAKSERESRAFVRTYRRIVDFRGALLQAGRQIFDLTSTTEVVPGIEPGALTQAYERIWFHVHEMEEQCRGSNLQQLPALVEQLKRSDTPLPQLIEAAKNRDHSHPVAAHLNHLTRIGMQTGPKTLELTPEERKIVTLGKELQTQALYIEFKRGMDGLGRALSQQEVTAAKRKLALAMTSFLDLTEEERDGLMCLDKDALLLSIRERENIHRKHNHNLVRSLVREVKSRALKGVLLKLVMAEHLTKEQSALVYQQTCLERDARELTAQLNAVDTAARLRKTALDTLGQIILQSQSIPWSANLGRLGLKHLDSNRYLEPAVRAAAVRFLASGWGGAMLSRVALCYLEDPHQDVRGAASRALRRWLTPEALNALLKKCQAGPSGSRKR